MVGELFFQPRMSGTISPYLDRAWIESETSETGFVLSLVLQLGYVHSQRHRPTTLMRLKDSAEAI